MRFKDHATEFGAVIENTEVKNVRVEDKVKVVETDGGEFRAKAMIIATGLSPVRIGIPGEEKLWGRGVSACATCDGPFYKDLKVAVIGGGDTAVEEAIYLTRFVKELHLVHRRDELRAVKLLQERAFAEPKIKFEWNNIPKEIKGKDAVEGLVVENVKTGEQRTLAVDGVFIFIGLKPISDWLGNIVDTDDIGCVLVDDDMQTNVPGIFAAGDVINRVYRQVVIAAGEGARAALAAEKYLEEHWSSKAGT